MRYLAPLFVLFMIGALAAHESVSAQPFRPPPPRERVQNGQVRSLGDIVNDVRRQRPGNLADVEGPNFGASGEPRYRLKWVSPDGRVQWLDTDARTGRVLGAQGANNNRPLGRPNALGPRASRQRGPGGPPFLAPQRGPRPGFRGGPGPGLGRGGPGGPAAPPRGNFGGGRFRFGR